ncbi:Aromatic amino acid beta-eliminating lyase/threonine aldolase, partial [Trinorchestia longiramus]
RFCPSWFNIPEIEPWLEESILPNHAYCKFCQKDLTAGKSELYKHMNTAKHRRKAEHYGFAPAIKNEDEFGMLNIAETLRRETDSCAGNDNPVIQDIKHRPPLVSPRLPALRKFAVYLADDMHVPHSKEMLEVIHNIGSDPCTTGRVRELEQRAAQLLGKEAAMFVLTGSMANSLAVMAHCPSNGSVVLAGDRSHLYRCCQTTLTRLNQVNIRVLRNTDDGRINLEEISSVMLEERDTVRPALLCLENCHTYCGGRVLPEHYMQQVGKMCAEYSLKLHVDGARLLHAAFACELSPALLTAYADSVTLCFNKGLEAQNGSVIAGSEDFIARCRQLSDVFCVSSVKTETLAATCARSLAGYVQHIARAQLHARNIIRS